MKIYLFCFLSFLCSCSGRSDAGYDDKIVSLVDSFALNYFNLDIPSSVKFCTPESDRWLRFYASNISENDLAGLRRQSEPASYEIEDVVMIDDTSAVVKCNVYNFLKISDIGTAGTIVGNESYCIPVVRRNGRWLVKMEGPLRSERRSRD